MTARGAPRVTVSGTKWVIDGTPAERLMSLRKPFTDRPTTCGRRNFELTDIAGFLKRALESRDPAEAMTRGQAVSAYTLGAARAEMREPEKGTLAPGKLADLAILSQDIFAVPPDALPATVSVLTLVGGAVVHEGT